MFNHLNNLEALFTEYGRDIICILSETMILLVYSHLKIRTLFLE